MDKSKVCVISASFGDYKSYYRSIDHLGVDGYIFTDSIDNIKIEGNNWKQMQSNYFFSKEQYMIPKYYKCYWHNIPELDKYDVIVWIDSTIEILTLPLEHIIEHDLVIYSHAFRKNSYAEIDASVDSRWNLYKDGLSEQKANCPKSKWLATTCFMVSKRNEKIVKMNNHWFSDIILYSPQCQASLPLACEYADVKVKLLDGGRGVRNSSHSRTANYIRHNHVEIYYE